MTTVVEPAVKACSKCETELSTTEFNRDRNTADGLSTVCRACNAEYCRAYRANRNRRAPQIPEYTVTLHHVANNHAPTHETANDRDWRHAAACRDEWPDLFFPIGNTGPALVQIHHAKAVCRRCPSMETCLSWALETGQDAGVWGGMSEDERRALKRRATRARSRASA